MNGSRYCFLMAAIFLTPIISDIEAAIAVIILIVACLICFGIEQIE